MINFSFIIPHHNNPDLLNRCIDSIPQREDIEIIVIDDNSDVDKKPQTIRSDVKLIYIDAEKTKGAGRARNYGVNEAKGKWLCFADSDDFFVPGFIDFFDRYVNSEVEVVYYDAKSVHTYTLEAMPELLQRQNSYFKRYDGGKDAEDLIRYRAHAPWWKMIKRDFVKRYQIQFEEVPKGNDIFFTYQVGYFAKKIAVERFSLYVHTFNPIGITNGKKDEKIILNHLCNTMKSYEFYRFIGHPEWIRGRCWVWFWMIRHSDFFVFIKTMFTYLINYQQLCKAKMEYVEKIRNRDFFV